MPDHSKTFSHVLEKTSKVFFFEQRVRTGKEECKWALWCSWKRNDCMVRKCTHGGEESFQDLIPAPWPLNYFAGSCLNQRIKYESILCQNWIISQIGIPTFLGILPMLDRDKYPLVEMPEPRKQSKGKDDKKWKAISAEGKLFASWGVCLSVPLTNERDMPEGFYFCPVLSLFQIRA